jgi:hypothetical protein
MATYQITGPDGSVYEVTAPEGATDAEIMAYAQRGVQPKAEMPAPLQPVSTGQAVLGTARNLLQGATLGFSDELEAAIAKGLDVVGVPSSVTGVPSNLTTEQYRQIIENQRLGVSQQFPTLSAGAELTGAFAPALLTGGQSIPASASLGSANVAPSLLRQTVKGGALGGLYGGTTAVGKSEGNIYERSADIPEGLALGTTFGMATPGIMAGGKKGLTALDELLLGGRGGELLNAGLNKVDQFLLGGKPEPVIKTDKAADKAKQLILESLRRDEITAPQAAARIAELEAKGVPDVMLPEVAGRATTQRLSAAANFPGGGIDTVSEKLIRNVQNQSTLLPKYLSDAFGVKGGNSSQMVDSIMASRSAQAAPLYNKAYFADPQGTVLRYVNDPKVNSLLKLPQFKDAADEVTELLRADGKIAADAKISLTPTVQNLDQIKRGLDALINKQTDAVTGKMTPLGKIYLAKKNEFLNAIDAAVPEYKAARAAYAGDTESITAIRLGRQVINASDDQWRDITKQLAAMPASNRGLAAFGVLDEIGLTLSATAQIPGGARAPDLTQLLTKVRNAERIEQFIPSMAERKLYRERLKALQSKASVKNAVAVGSRTGPMLAEMQDITGGPTSGQISSLATGNAIPFISSGVEQWIKNRRAGITEQVAKEMASNLTLTGKPLQDYLASLVPYQRKLFMDATREANKRAVAAGLSGYTAGALPTINKRPSSGPTTRGGARGLLD